MACDECNKLQNELWTVQSRLKEMPADEEESAGYRKFLLGAEDHLKTLIAGEEVKHILES